MMVSARFAFARLYLKLMSRTMIFTYVSIIGERKCQDFEKTNGVERVDHLGRSCCDERAPLCEIEKEGCHQRHESVHS